ncbi:armadillo-type protein [Mycena rebaudengoi]|nr:armadillo-type protein [Mycena rebaudengoi]
MAAEDKSQQIFQKLKPVCVPLLGASLLSPSSIPNLIEALDDVRSSGNILTTSLISYAFFPLSTMLSRNQSSAIPDQVMEKILLALKILCEDWWWDCDLKLWEQLFILCGSILGDIEGKTMGKVRDEETKDAAAQCLFSLLRPRSKEEAEVHSFSSPRSATTRLSELQEHTSSPRFTPIVGQTLNSLLTTAESKQFTLQRVSLDLLHVLISVYIPESLTTSVLPGVVSSMAKLAQGSPGGLGWAKGATVSGSLMVMQAVIVKSIGDDVCIKDGAVHYVEDLEDLADLTSPQPSVASSEPRRFSTARTPSWLGGTSSQLHIAINTLTPLVSHTTPSALIALVDFSSGILAATTLTLPQTQPLLLSFLLSLSNSAFTEVSTKARSDLLELLTTHTKAQQPLLQTLIRCTKENLSALPRLLLSQADSKMEHVAGLIEAVCRLATSSGSRAGIAPISAGIGALLGPTGGIEKWGWRLLSVLELVEPPMIVSRVSAAQLMLENDPGSSEGMAFPEVSFKHLSTRSAQDALVRMFHSLGRAAGDSCLSAAEWFVIAVSALWCACRLLEGVADISIYSANSGDSLSHKRTKRLEKMARGLAKSICEQWDHVEGGDRPKAQVEEWDDDLGSAVQLVKGLGSLHDTLKIVKPGSVKTQRSNAHPVLHKTLCLQLLAVSAGILQARFTHLLIYTLYPVLHSLVSPVLHLSSTALATLNFITVSASYASPANLLLSNFDYALDAVARRLTRRWLDVDATKVLVILVRLVGADVVNKAGDVVEECFDRLDEFHGYDVVVEGLVEVLGEVIKVIEEIPEPDAATNEPQPTSIDDEPPATTTQTLTKQIVSRSLYFLTHGSPVIRARILTLLASSVPVLPESALLPSIHSAWPFILNRLADSETFVVAAAASLIEALVTHVGASMYRRIWNDVWPRFQTMLAKLDAGRCYKCTLKKRTCGLWDPKSAYTHSHRLYRSLLKTMSATMKGVQSQDAPAWQAILAFRRFLHKHAHVELQRCGRDFYDAVWGRHPHTLRCSFCGKSKWEIQDNVDVIFRLIDGTVD